MSCVKEYITCISVIADKILINYDGPVFIDTIILVFFYAKTKRAYKVIW